MIHEIGLINKFSCTYSYFWITQKRANYENISITKKPVYREYASKILMDDLHHSVVFGGYSLL